MEEARALPYHPPMTQSMPPAEMPALAALRWLVEAGAGDTVREEPVNRFNRSAPLPHPKAPDASVLRAPDEPRARVAAVGAVDRADPIGRALEIAGGCTTLAELKAALEAFDGCALKQQATQTVFAAGTPDHRILFIAEAPGREEDAAGLPFVGRAGKLLDRMLAAIGLDRTTNVYITNVVNWRPPGNRDPSHEEAAVCLPFLRRHIELAAPEIIVLLGAVAVRHVMGRSDGIMRARGNWLEYHVNGHMVPVMPTLHPAYLLRRPVEKRLAWRDFQAIQTRIRELGLLEPALAPG